jgi:hypothetical protein
VTMKLRLYHCVAGSGAYKIKTVNELQIAVSMQFRSCHCVAGSDDNEIKTVLLFFRQWLQ